MPKRLIDLELFNTDLPRIEGSTESIISEMDAQRIIFDTILGTKPPEAIVNPVLEAIKGRLEDSSSFEDLLTTFCLYSSIGVTRPDLIPQKLRQEGSSLRNTTEYLAVSWMRWIAKRDDSLLLEALSRVEIGSSIEDIGIDYWAKGLAALAQEDLDTSKRFFERAIDVSSQFGFPSNPPICWTYAVTFLIVVH